MTIIHSILNSYAQFFNLGVIKATLSVPSNWGLIFSLVIMEGLLSSDNALVLAMMVRHLPENKQKKALTYGIWGAYLFRLLVIGIGVYLIKFAWIKILAAGYLLYMTFNFFKDKYNGVSTEEEETKAVQKGFWATVIAVELIDMTFSIDSVTAAFGVSSQVWILFLGAVFGILMMRGVAKVFVTLINKIPELETTAYVLIGIIGVKMILTVFGIDIPDLAFFAILIVTFIATFIVHGIKTGRVATVG